MKILHLSMECYPAAKAGGLGDVVGALPKYQNRLGNEAMVLMPKYLSTWISKVKTELVFEGQFVQYGQWKSFSVEKVLNEGLGFDLFLLDLPGYFDREGIYIHPQTGLGFEDEPERNVAFQKAALRWVSSWETLPDLMHCHDHHTSLVPFFMNETHEYGHLRRIPTVLTIHNGMYQGGIGWEKIGVMPAFHPDRAGLLEWNQHINSLACGVKCAWRVTTVSPGYMNELAQESRGMEMLYRMEWRKCIGLLNGIDNEVWNPETDTHLVVNYSGDIEYYKEANKRYIASTYGLNGDLPLFAFIGRFAHEKGADLLPQIISLALESKMAASFFVLGSGDVSVQNEIAELSAKYPGRFAYEFAYNEPLSRKIYAGSDFLLMPSRVEPCGLNQLYAFRYGTLPMVHAVGGLRDTVLDIRSNPSSGNGFWFKQLSSEEILASLQAAIDLYKNHSAYIERIQQNQLLDHSWETATEAYTKLYKEITLQKDAIHA